MPIKGTMGVADNHAMTKMLRQTKFPESFSTRVNLSKVNIPVLSQWVEEKVNSILGFEDEIVSSTAINLFMPTASEDAPPPIVDPRRAQLDLAGFLGEQEAASFAEELWGLLVDAQSTTTGIPKKLLEEKKKELAKRKAAASRPHHGSGMDRRVVEQASRRAERAREAIAAHPELIPGVGEPPAETGPRPVSPQHSKQPALRNNNGPTREEPKSPPQEKKSSSNRRESLDASSSRSSSEDSRSIDSEDDRGRPRRRDQRYRYEDEQDRRYYGYRDGRDHYGRRDYDQDRRRLHRDADRDPFGRRRRSRSRSRSHERDRRRYRGHR